MFQNEEFIEDASPEAKAVVLQRISPAGTRIRMTHKSPPVSSSKILIFL